MDFIEKAEKYLSDFDNLKETGHFPKIDIKDFTYYHKDLTLEEFLCLGREIIRLKLVEEKNKK